MCLLMPASSCILRYCHAFTLRGSIFRRLLPLPSFGFQGAGYRRSVSTGRRDFYQRLNEEHLAHELKNLSITARGGAPEDFNPKVPFKGIQRHRRPKPAPVPQSALGDLPSTSSELKGGGFIPSAKTQPWLHYESMRGDAWKSETGPRWQDLTHGEAQRLQEMHMRKRMIQRKILWMKSQHLPNPQKDAKMEMRRRENAEKSEGNDMYPPPFSERELDTEKFSTMVAESQRDELESRFRSRIREQKLENARIVKANVPNVGHFIADPIKRHVNRRLLRQRTKIHAGLEETLTPKSSQILHEFLRGAAVSIVRVRAKRPRQTQELIYNLTSDHDPAWVQKQLDVLAPKLRSQFAVKVHMGQTPDIRFVPQVPLLHTRRSHLWRFARQIQDETPTGSMSGFARSGGVPVPHGTLKRLRARR